MYRCWLVTRHGKRLAYMVGEAIDRAEALKLIAKCKIPKVRQFIARRLAGESGKAEDKK